MSGQAARMRHKAAVHARSWDLAPLRVGGRTGWRLRQRLMEGRLRARRRGTAEVARVTGWRADLLLPVLVDCVRRAGHEPPTIVSREQPFRLPEAEGYRLALAFRLSKRTDSPRQVERIVRAVRQFEEEEAYLWYSYLLRADRNGGESRLAQALANLGEAFG